MQFESSALKKAVKFLSLLKTEVHLFLPSSLAAQDPDVLVVVGGFAGIVEKPIAVNGKRLTATLNRMSGLVSISHEGNSLTIKGGTKTVVLETQTVRAPHVPNVKTPFDLTLKPLIRALTLASSTAGTKRSQAFGNCVGLSAGNVPIEVGSVPGSYRVEGFDNHVLTRVTVPETFPLDLKMSLNLSAASAVRLLTGDTAKLSFFGTGTAFSSEEDKVEIYATNPPYAYPETDKIFFKDAEALFKLDTALFSDSIRTVEPLVDTSLGDGSGVTCSFSGDVVSLFAVDSGSRAEDSSPYEQVYPDPIFDPKDVTVKLKLAHLASFLNKAGKDFLLRYIAPDKPVQLVSGDTQVLTMPMRGK
jgi:hypothetical protein